MKILKDNWSLTGDLTGSINPLSPTGVRFTTGWYDMQILTPQISITPSFSIERVLNLQGDYYLSNDFVNVDVWIRPQMTSNTSMGKTKADRWSMVQEVRKIIREHRTDYNFRGLRMFHLTRMSTRDEMNEDPPLLRTEIQVKCIYTQ